MNANEILFRASGIGYLMTEPQGKTNSEKYYEALAQVDVYKKQYSDTVNKGTKTAVNLHAKILKANTVILELEKHKDDFEPSDTCKSQLIRVYAQSKGRREELKNKFLDKGNERENDAITLLSLITKKFFKKNSTRLENKFISGEPDLYLGESIHKADETLDTKCSWSYITFLEAQEKKLNSIYEYQGQSYMWLTGAKKHTVVYCLVNGTFKYLNDELRRLSWKHGVLDADISADENFIKDVQQLERNVIFDIDSFMKENRDYMPKNNVWYDQEKDKYSWDFDIPKEERIYMISFDRDEEMIEKIEARIVKCRQWLNKNYFEVC